MTVIDAHVHLYPPEINRDPEGWAQRSGETHWATLCTRRRKDGRPVQRFPSVQALLQAMDEGGISQALLLGWYWETPAACALQNRFYAKVAREHPDRFLFFGSIHPGAGARAVEEELLKLRDEGCLGLGELSPHTQGLALPWGTVWTRAAEWGWPVNLHVTDPRSRPFPGRRETPLDDFLRWARRYPKTNYILAHWGGGLAGAEEARRLPNVYFDTAASPLLYTGDEEEVFLEGLPSERVVWGSDHPLILYPRGPEQPEPGHFRREFAGRRGVNEGIMGANLQALLAKGR